MTKAKSIPRHFSKSENNLHHCNYQDLLKLVAVICMTIDHIGLYIYPEVDMFRVVGRLVMPIFYFFAGYNYNPSFKPNHKFLAFGLLLYFFQIFITNRFIIINSLVTIYLWQFLIYFIHSTINRFTPYIYPLLGIGLLLITFEIIEYGSIGMAVVIAGYSSKKYPTNIPFFSAIAVFLSIYYSYFAFPLGNIEEIVLICVSFMEYFALSSIINFNTQIPINISGISRNTAFIYFIQIIFLQYAAFLLVV